MTIHEHDRRTSVVTGQSYGLAAPGTGRARDSSAFEERAAMPKVVINTIEQYEAVMREIEKMSRTHVGSKEHALLIELLDAAQEWDRGKGSEVAGDTERAAD